LVARCAALLLLAVAPLTATAQVAAPGIDTLQRIRDTGTIRIGARDSAAPFASVDAQGKAHGYTVDLCLRVAEAIRSELKLSKLDIRYVVVTAANRIDKVRANEVDLECGSTTNTRERQQQVAFAYTTMITGIRLLVKADSGVREIDDLRGKTVVVTKGTTGEAMLRQLDRDRLLKLSILVGSDHVESFKAVEDGKAAAFLNNDVLHYGLISKAKRPADFAVVGKFFSIDPYAIMLRRDDAAFERLVNRALLDLFQSGEIRRIYAKWFTTRELTIPMSLHTREAFAMPNTHPAWP
jgi:glutamate/aspartate transport system substrate-binding protein